MRRSTAWVAALTLLAAMPAASPAGPFDFFRGSKDEAARNQETAEQIAEALRAAKLQGRDVEIEFKGGTAILTGTISDATQRAKATQAASHVQGVESVDNRMRLAGSRAPQPTGRILPTAATEPQGGVRTAAATNEDPWATTARPQRPETSVFSEARTAPKPTNIRRTAAAQPARPAASTERTNQEIAQSIADSISTSNVRGRRIRIRVLNGTAEIGGEVASRGEWDTVTRVVGTVPGVERVNNKMTVTADAAAESFAPQYAAPMPQQYAGQMPPQQYAGQMPPQYDPRMAQAMMARQPQPQIPTIVPTSYQPPAAGQPAPGQPAPAAPGGFVPPGADVPAPLPGYGHPGPGMASHQAYSMPNMPEYAWPSYANYPNSAQISYPTQYSASAWPYIGPFYPYPQVPLGWREAQLEWDDGYWHLNFRPRTSKWYWFVNPKNW